MKIGSATYFRDSLKETIMTNYTIRKATPLASKHANFEAEIKNSTTLQPQEKEVYLQNLQKAYKQTRAEIFGIPED